MGVTSCSGVTPSFFCYQTIQKKTVRLLFLSDLYRLAGVPVERGFFGCCEVRFFGSRYSFEFSDSFSSSWMNLVAMDYKTWITMSWSGSFSARASERFGLSSMLITIQFFNCAFKPTRSWLRDCCLIIRRPKKQQQKWKGGFLVIINGKTNYSN